MKETVDIGMNRTGVQMSPLMSQKMEEEAQKNVPSKSLSPDASFQLRRDYLEGTETIGSVPPPGTVSGVMQTGVGKLTGKNPEVLIDKLGERLAFERSGVRLYDALLEKCRTSPTKKSMPISEFEHYRKEEAQHFALLRKHIADIGADPTAQTPSADASAVASMGLIQVLRDPRTSIIHAAEAILTAELVDHDGWETLIQLADDMGFTDMAKDFRQALDEENEHLQGIRDWHGQMVRDEIQLLS